MLLLGIRHHHLQRKKGISFMAPCHERCRAKKTIRPSSAICRATVVSSVSIRRKSLAPARVCAGGGIVVVRTSLGRGILLRVPDAEENPRERVSDTPYRLLRLQ